MHLPRCQTAPRRARFRGQVLGAAALAFSLTLVACGDDDDATPGATAESTAAPVGISNPGSSDPQPSPADSTANSDATLFAAVASFDLSIARPQRVMFGLSTDDGQLLAGGRVQVAFRYGGTRERPIDPPEETGNQADAEFLPVPGDPIPGGAAATDPPQLGPPSAGRGVYAAQNVRFDRAGFWYTEVTAKLPDRTVTAQTPFEVYERAHVADVGDPAPSTRNLVLADIGTDGVTPNMLDSLADPAGKGEDITDPDLHQVRISEALAAKRPLVVVVSTPAFCQSAFCGPVTDIVAGRQKVHGDRVDFVHLEVWRDFEKKELNAAAAEWILPKGAQGEGREPWIFLVGSDGKVAARFDNLAAESDLDAAIKTLK